MVVTVLRACEGRYRGRGGSGTGQDSQRVGASEWFLESSNPRSRPPYVAVEGFDVLEGRERE